MFGEDGDEKFGFAAAALISHLFGSIHKIFPKTYLPKIMLTSLDWLHLALHMAELDYFKN